MVMRHQAFVIEFPVLVAVAAEPVTGMSLFPPNDLQELPSRERILLAAHKLFYSFGIRATGIDRVITESGVAKVTFYRHFPSENELTLLR